MGWTLFGKYKEKTIEQTALCEYQGYLRVKEAINEDWVQRQPYKKKNLEQVVDKLDNFVSAVNCAYCNNPAEYLTIVEIRGDKHNPYNNKDAHGLKDMLVYPEAKVLCENHRHEEVEADKYPIKFSIIEKFDKRNREKDGSGERIGKYDIQKENIARIYNALKLCAGFSGKISEPKCRNFFMNLKQKQKPIVQPVQVQKPVQGQLF
jgi:hypothetical protein